MPDPSPDETEDLRQENRRLLASAAQFQGEAVALRRALSGAEPAQEQLALIRAELEERRHRLPPPLAEGLEALGRRLEAVEAQLAALSGRLEAQLARAAAADARHEDAARTLEAVRLSTSWRLTGPLRRLGRLLGPGRGG